MDVDVQGVASQSGSAMLPNCINDEITNFNQLRENVSGKLNLDNWMVLPSQRTLHIFCLNKKLNGNLSIRSTIFIDVNLVVKVFGENDDDKLFSLKLYSWPQLQTLIKQCGAHVKREFDLDFNGVVDKTGNLEMDNREVRDQQESTLAFQVDGRITKAEVSDFHQPLVELIEGSIAESESLGYDPDEIDHQHFSGESYPCNVCGREFQSSIGLRMHVKSNHTTVRGEFVCDICNSGRDFETKESLEKHIKKRHCSAPMKERTLNCSTCDENFPTQDQLTVHMKRHDKSKWKPCPICNKSYISLNRHIRDRHSNVRNHICDICGSTYKQWSSLKEHIELKHMDTPNSSKKEEQSLYACETCGKTFTFKRLLTTHVKLHSGKQHVCDECGRSFRHPKYLVKHLKQHKDIVKLRCTMCEKEYVQKVGLRLHMKKIHGVVLGTTQNSDSADQV